MKAYKKFACDMKNEAESEEEYFQDDEEKED